MVMLPNESRLSCGATLKYSQMEFYHNARKTFSGSIRDARRQLQALLGCAPQVIARVLPCRGAQGALTVAGLHRDCDAEWTDARNSPTPPPPAHNGTFIG